MKNLQEVQNNFHDREYNNGKIFIWGMKKFQKLKKNFLYKRGENFDSSYCYIYPTLIS